MYSNEQLITMVNEMGERLDDRHDEIVSLREEVETLRLVLAHCQDTGWAYLSKLDTAIQASDYSVNNHASVTIILDTKGGGSLSIHVQDNQASGHYETPVRWNDMLEGVRMLRAWMRKNGIAIESGK